MADALPQNLEELMRVAFRAMAQSLWTSMPVSLVEDSDGKTVRLQPTIKTASRKDDGTFEYSDMPELHEIPIKFAGGGDVTTTLPLKKGGEGIAIFAAQPIASWHQSGGVQQPVDARSHHLSDAIFIPGIRSQPRDLKDINTEAAETRTDDGKHRTITHPKDGVKVSVDGGKQLLDVNATTGAIEAKSKTVTLASGEVAPGAKPNTANTVDRDLNEQLKGLSARVGQVEKTAHALFDVTSKFRELVQARIPEVAAVAPILNQQPGGLDAMVGAIEGKAMAYLQTQAQQALGMFMSPSIAGVASLLAGGVEGQIAALTAQIEKLAAENPVVGQVGDLQRQVDAILARGAAAAVQAAQLGPVQDQIAALTRDNPVVGLVQDLQRQIAALSSQAGAGLNFLEPQQRLARGAIKSLHLSGD